MDETQSRALVAAIQDLTRQVAKIDASLNSIKALIGDGGWKVELGIHEKLNQLTRNR